MKQKLIQKNSPSHAAPLKAPNSSRFWKWLSQPTLESLHISIMWMRTWCYNMLHATMTNDLMDQGPEGQMPRVWKDADDGKGWKPTGQLCYLDSGFDWNLITFNSAKFPPLITNLTFPNRWPRVGQALRLWIKISRCNLNQIRARYKNQWITISSDTHSTILTELWPAVKCG